MKQEMTVALEPVAEREADSMDLVDLYAELEALEQKGNGANLAHPTSQVGSKWRSIPARGAAGRSWT
jgi:hypothetical protein